MYVEWSAPAELRHPNPVVLVHGGGGQATDWLGTPDGRPGWATHLVDDGWLVYVVDRPGYGRSVLAAERAGSVGPSLDRESAEALFHPAPDRHTQWPGEGALAQIVAAASPMPVDQASAQRREQRRMAELLTDIGPAVLMSHSVGAPCAWLAADACPELVTAIVALEPVGPPFFDHPALGFGLDWGLTTAPMTFAPRVEDPAQLGDGTPRVLPNLRETPIVVVSSEASPLAGVQGAIVDWLRAHGCDAEHVALAEHGIRGNGHGMIFERNLQDVQRSVLNVLAAGLASGTP
jgi:pimeloyl-ACP methyl ester carboxylesterase